MHSPDDAAGRKGGNPTPEPSGDLPRPHVLARPTHNLPIQLSSFIGREREIEQVNHLLSGSRLVTLTGVGGCGKMRVEIFYPPEGTFCLFKPAFNVPYRLVHSVEAPVQTLQETLDWT